MIEKRIISICDYLELDKSFDSFLKWILELRKELNIPHKLSEIVDVNKIAAISYGIRRSINFYQSKDNE